MIEIQLDLFEPYTEMNALQERTIKIEKQVHNVRRGLFSRFGDLCKSLVSATDRISALEERVARQEEELRQLRETICWMERVS